MTQSNISKTKISLFDFGNQEFTILSDWNAGIGGGVWSSGLELCTLFQDADKSDNYDWNALFSNKNAVELGCGTGLIGIVISRLFPVKNMILTDTESHMGIISTNILRNSTEFVFAEQLDWFNPSNNIRSTYGDIDVIIGTDVVYHRSLFAPFLNVCRSLASPHTVILLVINKLDTDLDFFIEAYRAGWSSSCLKLEADKHLVVFLSLHD